MQRAPGGSDCYFEMELSALIGTMAASMQEMHVNKTSTS